MTNEYDVYRVLMESCDGTAVSDAEWRLVGKGKRAHILDVLAGRIEPDDTELRELRQARGGCRCQDPGAMPPCSACTEPMSVEEAFGIALVRRAERQPITQPEGWGDW